MPEQRHVVLAARARWQLIGAGVGIVAVGALASLVGRPEAITAAGLAMLALGALVAVLFPEQHFARVRRDHVRTALAIARKGATLAVRDRTLLVLLVVAVLVSGAGDSFARIYPVQLADLGLPVGSSGTRWFTALSLGGYATAVVALLIAQRRLHSDRGSRATLAAACLVGTLSLLLLGLASDLQTAVVGVLLLSGVALPVTGTASTIWVNRRTTSDVRATTHSFLAQAEYFLAQAEYAGEIGCAPTPAALAQRSGAGGALAITSTLFAAALVVIVVSTHRPRRALPAS